MRWPWLSAALLTACAHNHTQGPSRAEELLQLESQRCEAAVKADVEALGALLADDLTYIHSTGVSVDKAGFLQGIRSGQPKYLGLRPLGPTVRFDGNIAVLTGKVAIVVELGGKQIEATLLTTGVWRRDQGRWRLWAYQSTRAAPP